MLVLTRKKNESIVIDDYITVTVVEIRGDKVRLGIEAPREVSVHRKEIYEHIKSKTNEPGKLEKNVDDPTQTPGGGLGGDYLERPPYI